MISLAGFDVETFASAEALLARGLPEGEICVVLKIDLPGDGVELMCKLDTLRLALPTIFITALAPGGLNERLAALAPWPSCTSLSRATSC